MSNFRDFLNDEELFTMLDSNTGDFSPFSNYSHENNVDLGHSEKTFDQQHGPSIIFPQIDHSKPVSSSDSSSGASSPKSSPRNSEDGTQEGGLNLLPVVEEHEKQIKQERLGARSTKAPLPSTPPPKVENYCYPGASLSFANGAEFPEQCNPQVPKKISLKLTGFPTGYGVPMLAMRVWAENPQAIRVAGDFSRQRSSLERRAKKREGVWSTAIDAHFPFEVDDDDDSVYMWNSFLQFTHLSQYEDERRASSGQLMVLFYVKGSQPNSHDALLLRTSKITVVRRVSKTKKSSNKVPSPPKPPPNADKILSSLPDEELGREIKRSFSKLKNKKLKDIIEALDGTDENEDTQDQDPSQRSLRSSSRNDALIPVIKKPKVDNTSEVTTEVPTKVAKNPLCGTTEDPSDASVDPKPSSQLAINWFNKAYPQEYQVCLIVVEKDLREFNEVERGAIVVLAELFDKFALIMAEVETMGNRASDLAKAVHASVVNTRFKTCAKCMMRGVEIRNMYKNFQGEWWKDDEINARFNLREGKITTLMSRIITNTPAFSQQYRAFANAKASAKAAKEPKQLDGLYSQASELDVPGIMLKFGRVSLDDFDCVNTDMSAIIEAKKEKMNQTESGK